MTSPKRKSFEGSRSSGSRDESARELQKVLQEKGSQGEPSAAAERLPQWLTKEYFKRQTQEAPESSPKRQPDRLLEKTTEVSQPKKRESGTLGRS